VLRYRGNDIPSAERDGHREVLVKGYVPSVGDSVTGAPDRTAPRSSGVRHWSLITDYMALLEPQRLEPLDPAADWW